MKPQSSERSERRSAPRYVLPLPLTGQRTPAPESVPFPGTIRNVSIRGIYFTTNQKLTPGAVLVLRFVLPEEMTNSEEVLVQARSRVLRLEAEAGAERVGVAAVFEHYEIVTTKPDRP